MAELSRIDITRKVSMMSSYTTILREGHLDHVVYMISYLKVHHNLLLVPTYLDIDMDDFKHHNWKQLYGDVKKN